MFGWLVARTAERPTRGEAIPSERQLLARVAHTGAELGVPWM
jgi:hypothetical protein